MLLDTPTEYNPRSDTLTLQLQLYNTMQVREATRNTKMSQIMLVFTIATIIYLPLTFVAVSHHKTTPIQINRR